jgi:hypothetical protein
MGRDGETGFSVEQRNKPFVPVSLFDRRPFLRPDLPMPGRQAETPSRLAVAPAATPAAASPGHALTAASTASSWLQS